MAEETERIYVIPLKKKGYTSSKAAPTAMKRVKTYLTKHMKVEENDIWIDESLNKAIWSRGKYKMPSKIRVKAVRFEDGVVEAYLPELEFTKSRREILQEEREKKQPILRKEEAPEEEEMDEESGTEDYDVVPGPDGEVKIKKKKAAKKEEEESEEDEKPAEEKEEDAAQGKEESQEAETEEEEESGTEKKETDSSDESSDEKQVEDDSEKKKETS